MQRCLMAPLSIRVLQTGRARLPPGQDFHDVGAVQPNGSSWTGAQCGLARLHGGAGRHVHPLCHIHEVLVSWLTSATFPRSQVPDVSVLPEGLAIGHVSFSAGGGGAGEVHMRGCERLA